ncbi:hypothetical protein C8A03DRAFT_35102 [Achaetomium macrosporum]|uniref:Ion transport domain-containing protein n=1 Tax=Achaetomium macrosporum TaxID=79813 RepID=A0AAN7HEA4_9PEZI|nr:hypothetical protein C8A03DRAFT_35102 [Achaetomium macrosporum]
MLSALLRPFKGSSSQVEEHADLEQDILFRPSIAEYRRHLHATADFTEADDDDDEESNDGEGTRRPEDEDGVARSSGLLPLFSANHLDSLSVYGMTHAIRIIVQTRTETTLSWDQLRSPQVSQFLIKPMQQQIRTQHFSPSTLYALMANCLQFEKEGQLCPGNTGTSTTRAKVCELLAIKLLKEYTTRDLIDALCYDFYPLQGIPGSQTPLTPGDRPMSATPRTSTLEVAIRASAKHFLSHPLVKQQLEAIWNGAISLFPNREEPPRDGSASSASGSNLSRRQSTVRTPLLGDQGAKEGPGSSQYSSGPPSVALYDPRTASVFKLSRLRVPRYRRILSRCSLVVLICLFLAVLAQRSSKITTLELLFWFWSAGFMLDEIVGFNEQGFSFYVMSFWNIFDLAILLLLIVYYCMRIYGVFLLDPHKWNQNAYDVLAVNAILLLPRIFTVLDSYPYFSQLLIALRLLAVDLAAITGLILACCSGFFAFFVFFKHPDDQYSMAFKLFQILMGFTSSAWEIWPTYDWMGKTLMSLFLVISHFLILTMLITVLTNSFMSIASRASQEYQFAFAINTMSMAKSDALFSYIAPGNVVAWALMPLRYCMARNHYIWLNRAVIKATHFPVLLCIYIYERCFLAPDVYEATDLVDKPRRGRQHRFSDPASRSAFFDPSIRVREESALGYQKDRVLEELFRRAPDMRTQRRNERRKTQTAFRTWMGQHGGGYNSPQNYSTIGSRVGSDWHRRLSMNRERPSKFPRDYSAIRSAASDPADFISDAPYPLVAGMYNDGIARRDYAVEVKENTDGDADGDDELVTNDEDEEDNATNTVGEGGMAGEEAVEDDYFTTPVAARFTSAELSIDSPRPPTSRRVPLHTRTLSTNTILYAPEDTQQYSSSSASAWPVSRAVSRPVTNRHTPVATPITRDNGRRSPRRSLYLPSHPRPGDVTSRTAPHRTGLTLEIPSNNTRGKPSFTRRRSLADLDALVEADDTLSARSLDISNNSRMSKLMLAKMKSLEESLGDMVREMRTLRKSVPNTAHNSDEALSGGDNTIGGSGGGVGSRSWASKQHHPHHNRHRHQTRIFPGSDPSSSVSISGGVPAPPALIEVAVAQGRDRDRTGSKRPRAATAVTTRRVIPGSHSHSHRRQGGGVWRSPREDSTREGGGFGITGRGGVGVRDEESGKRAAKGKGREWVLSGGEDVADGDSPAMSPDGDGELAVSVSVSTSVKGSSI